MVERGFVRMKMPTSSKNAREEKNVWNIVPLPNCWWKRNKHTLPETNMAPENRPVEKEIPVGTHHFRGKLLVSGMANPSFTWDFQVPGSCKNQLAVSMAKNQVI